MGIDREDTLRRAEKLLRQGKLDGAIQEYARLLEEQPNDWNTRNVLGDLYVRANQLENAAAQFTQIADHFAHEGFLPRAVALYKKVIKIKPDDEHALLQSADISARQGLLAEAKSALGAIAERKWRRGDKNGANEIIIRIATLDPADLGARMGAARAAAEMGDAEGAAKRYKDLAAELFNRERPNEALDALAEAVHLDASDEPARDALVGAYLQRGDIDRARSYGATAANFKAIAEALAAKGQEKEAIDALFDAVQRDPADNVTRARLVRQLFARGDLERAAACLTPDVVGSDPALLMLSAEIHLRSGRKDAGRELMRAVLERDPRRRDEVTALAASLAATDRDLAFECVEVCTDAAVAAKDWAGAAAALQQFLHHAKAHVPALIKLVDVCVDGDLDDILFAAQADLAEAYLAAGRAFEARVIAEDLVTRAPTDAACIDRFRRALVMLGESNPDAIIADRVSPDAGLAMGDLNDDLVGRPGKQADSEAAGGKVIPFARNAEPPDAPVVVPAAPASLRGGGAGPLATAPLEEAAEPVVAPTPAAREPGRHAGSETGRGTAVAAAGPAVPGEAKGARQGERAPAAGTGEGDEIDLSHVLTGMHPQEPLAPPDSARRGAPPPAARRDLEDVFADLRDEVMKEQATSTAAQQYKLALTYHDMGMTADCIKALETAARSPRYRFQAASLLGRIHRQEGRVAEAIDWFERAAETPATSADAGRALLYELGQTLEGEGEAVRALAVYLELQADAGDYRDVAARIKRLSR